MKPIISELVKNMDKEFKADARHKGLLNKDLEERLNYHKTYETLRQDWAEKRVNSIFREVERYGIKIDSLTEDVSHWRGQEIKASYEGVAMEGRLMYQAMDPVKAYRAWRRPKIVATFWILDSKGEKCYLEGHVSSAFKVVFGAKRMMTYNRLAPALLNAIAR